MELKKGSFFFGPPTAFCATSEIGLIVNCVSHWFLFVSSVPVVDDLRAPDLKTHIF